MIKITPLLSIISVIILLCSCQTESSHLIIPVQVGEEPSDDFSLMVNKRETFVYRARVSAYPINQVWPGYQRPEEQTELASFAYFDCDGPVEVELISAKQVYEVTIRPLSYGIVPVIDGNTIRFDLPGPKKIVVEVNDRHHAFHLFASHIESDKPDPMDPKVHYFGPGIHEPGTITLESDETVYIDTGAIVFGNIEASDAKHIKIAGHGILDASKIGRFDARQMVSLDRCEDVTVEGIICRDPHVWTVIARNCRNVRISDLKLIGLWRYNADGIDLVNSQDVLIEDCFIRAFDDNIALKGMKRRDLFMDGSSLRNIEVRNCVLWNDWGRALEIGAETVADSIYNIRFLNCDIIHFVHIAMDIQNGDRALITNVLFENIRVEEPIKDRAQIAEYVYPLDEIGKLVDLNIRANNYSKDTIRGKIENITFRNITYTGTPFPHTTMEGLSAMHSIRNIYFENIVINEKRIEGLEDLNLQTNEYVSSINVK
ncbi:MAG: hypothetical protein DRI98_04920 [Bacteroidetes bacterium]|nr:MAG: hypothetical protein DRI98_04920 [Bacteroidota bacterium]